MFKYFKGSFAITNANMILLTPLVIFLLVFSLYVGLTQNVPPSFLSYFLASITIVSMVSAFFSGWLNMIKKAIANYSQNFEDETAKAKASLRLLKDFTVGIGENFLAFIWAFVIQIVLLTLVVYFVKFVGLKFIGPVNVSFAQINAIAHSPVALDSFLRSLSVAEVIKVNYWNLLIVTVMSAFSLVTMFYLPSIVYKTQNPLKAMLVNFKFVFKNFWMSLGLFVSLTIVHLVVSLLLNLTTYNAILYFLSTLLYFYFVAYVVVLVFYYYEQKIKA